MADAGVMIVGTAGGTTGGATTGSPGSPGGTAHAHDRQRRHRRLRPVCHRAVHDGRDASQCRRLPTMSAAELQTLRQWIQDGAKGPP